MNTAAHIPDWMLDWARLEPHVENALEYSGGTHTVEDVFLGVANGDYQFWPGEESVVITEVLEKPRKTVLHYFLAGGNLGELEEMAEEIEGWARKEKSIDMISLTGRKGWARTFLGGRGYEKKLVYMTKEL